MKHYEDGEDGLETVKDPSEFKDKLEWIKEHLNRVREAWDAANFALKGEDPKVEPKPVKFDPSKFTPTPANTAKQRLGMSAFKK